MQNHSWQKLLANALTDPAELLQLLELDPQLLPEAKVASQQFGLRVPRGFINRIQKGDRQDPLLQQILPLGLEQRKTSGFTLDPLGELQANPLPGLLHKYQGRVLLILNGACAINCRYCFRREFPYENNVPGRAGLQKIMAYIQADPTITEVILSGGDPLVVSDAYLTALINDLAAIPHVSTLRLHTRLPIVLPERITDELLTWYTGTRLKPVMVIHCNHANEIDDSVRAALAKLQHAGVILLNQSVLLKGINDSAKSLIELSERLFQSHVLPYYLHLLDRVKGTAHFEVDAATAKQLIAELRMRLPGYLVPKLVREEAGAKHKLVVE